MRALALIAAALFAVSALAQLRTIPSDAKRAKMSHVQDRIIQLDGKRELLAPGARIRDAANRFIVPGALPANSLVRYRRDPNGAVHDVWILTPQEAAQR
ncbi:MAG TPA: hypothetical protein VFJ70_12405 [Burkholderiales bacterium]|nr:hypothetical protein [Burkholderiales bacterium]